MIRSTCRWRLPAICAVLVGLQGCAAATVVRQPPDFEEDRRQRLLQTFQPETLAATPIVYSLRNE